MHSLSETSQPIVVHRPGATKTELLARTNKHLFVTLDGMRGVAALAVILFHLPGLLGPLAFPHGYLAVDFFFILSGFVLAFAYQPRLDAGWPSLQFLRVRFARLYPLYAVSMLLGFVALRTTGAAGSMGTPARAGARLLLGLALLPSFAADQLLFPLNLPSWSISFELLGNAVHAALLRRRSTLTLGLLCVAGAVGTVWYGTRISHLNFGSTRPIAFAGLYRLLFAYVAGMLLCAAWQRTQRRRFGVPALLMPLVLLSIFALPQVAAPWRIVLDLSLALAAFPALVLLSAQVEPGPGLARTFRFLGAVSYPVYLLHFPLYQACAGLWPHVRHRAAWHDWVFGPVFLMLLVSLAVLLERTVDLPVRAWMLRHMKAQKAST